MMGDKRDGNNLGDKPSFVSVLYEESSKKKANFYTLVTDNTYLADVLIPMLLVLEVYARSYGGQTWFHLHSVFLYGWFERADGLSAIATCFVTPIMLDSCTTTTCMQSWGRMGYARALIDIRADRALKDTMVILVPNLIRNGVIMHTIKVEYEWKSPRCETCLTFGNDDMKKDFGGPLGSKKGMVGKPMDDLVDDTQKKIEAPPKKNPRKTSIWSGKKADSSKRNIVFSHETKVTYFDRDDMDFDDVGYAVEEVQHKNAYSENG
ncbi:hypothetical protein Tco_0010396 [Tanacetum coccineum]